MTALLGLGTVQFGTEYGISNAQGMLTAKQGGDILAEARAQSVAVLDTAALYGSSEESLGCHDLDAFKIVTKTPRFTSAVIRTSQVKELKDVFLRSLNRLNQPSVYALLSHDADNLLAPGGEMLWQAMEDIKLQGRAEKIGVSIYDGSQVDSLMARYSLDIVQVPLNILDQRLIQGGQLERLCRAGVEVHARSIFLQGLLLMDEYPTYFDPIKENLECWKRKVAEQGLSTIEAALAFVRDQAAVDVVLVGVTDVAQFTACLSAFHGTAHFDGCDLACSLPQFVDPSRWKIK